MASIRKQSEVFSGLIRSTTITNPTILVRQLSGECLLRWNDLAIHLYGGLLSIIVICSEFQCDFCFEPLHTFASGSSAF
jgi:hypothetical protein